MKTSRFISVSIGFAIVLGMLAMPALAQYGGSGTFTKITTLPELTDGYYVIANSLAGFAMNNGNDGSFFKHTAIAPSNDQLTNPDAAIVWKLETDSGGFTIYNEASSRYVSYKGSANAAQAVASVTGDAERWTFTVASGIFSCANKATPTRILHYPELRDLVYKFVVSRVFLGVLSQWPQERGGPPWGRVRSAIVRCLHSG